MFPAITPSLIINNKNNCALLTLINFNLNVLTVGSKVLICALELFEYCLLDMGEKNFKLYVW